jgi:hypothetical protein
LASFTLAFTTKAINSLEKAFSLAKTEDETQVIQRKIDKL